MPSKGYQQSEEHKRKIAEWHQGKSPTEKTRQKLRVAKRRENHPNWKGGIHKDSEGYIKLKMREHPRADCNGYVRRNILVWEEHHGPVPKGVVVHHVNGNREDDRIENLKALHQSRHVSLHKKGCNQPKKHGKFVPYLGNGNVMVTQQQKGVTACAVTP